jgi:hypothetical protein
MSALDLLIDGLKRQVAVPGEFDTSFPNTANSDLLGSLADAFGQAQLDGFFGTMVYDPSDNTVTPDLSPGGAAIIGLYAAENVLMAKFRNVFVKTRYKAGPVEYEADLSANVLSAQIKDLQDRRKALLVQALRLDRAGSPSVYVTDAYVTRSFGFLPWFGGVDMSGFGFWTYELAGPW